MDTVDTVADKQTCMKILPYPNYMWVVITTNCAKKWSMTVIVFQFSEIGFITQVGFKHSNSAGILWENLAGKFCRKFLRENLHSFRHSVHRGSNKHPWCIGTWDWPLHFPLPLHPDITQGTCTLPPPTAGHDTGDLHPPSATEILW